MTNVPAIIAIFGLIAAAAHAVYFFRQWWRHRNDPVIRPSDSPRFIRKI